jgi:hypothetical protein
MPLKKLIFKPGVNKENTRYTTEGGWYECNNIRFRQGTPEKLGGWKAISFKTFLGVCRSLWNWVTLGFANLMAVGTSLKYYIEKDGTYYDITPIEATRPSVTNTLTGPFSFQAGSPVVTVIDSDAPNVYPGDQVTFSGFTAGMMGFPVPIEEINTIHTVTERVSTVSYKIEVTSLATSSSSFDGNTGTAFYNYRVVGMASNPFYVEIGSRDVIVTQTSHGKQVDQFVIFANVVGLDEMPINGEHRIVEIISPDSYKIVAAAPSLYFTGNTGGSSVTAQYLLAPGGFIPSGNTGWGQSGWGLGGWGQGASPTGQSGLRLWSEANYGEDLVFGPRGGGLYYWDATLGLDERGVDVSTLPGASSVPVIQNLIGVSDTNRFVFCFGCNDLGSLALDPMLVRWSDQESVTEWFPQATNQAGSIRLSSGSQIISALQTRQEFLVWTDSALYSLQYLGPPYVWGSNVVGENLSIISQNSASTASGVVFWMGLDKFYRYDGRVQTLRCDLRQHIFNNINLAQADQIFSGTNEGFNEVWWFYCSKDSDTVDKYVIYNYAEDIWYYGDMARTAWVDSGLRDYPVAATYLGNLVNHEEGVDDNATGLPVPMDSYIASSEFDIDDGHNFGFIWRILPDITFRGSSIANPRVTMSLTPLQNSGSGYNNPPSVGGENFGSVVRTAEFPVEQFTGQLNIRVRGRQLVMRITSSNQVGVNWQLGAPRIDIKQDGRR